MARKNTALKRVKAAACFDAWTLYNRFAAEEHERRMLGDDWPEWANESAGDAVDALEEMFLAGGRG